MDERTAELTSEATPARAEIQLDDLVLSDDEADRVKGGAEPTNERVRPGEGLQHNETVLRTPTRPGRDRKEKP